MPNQDLSILFTQSFDPQRGLSDDDFAAAADALGIEVAMIKAVAKVESPRGPFDAKGRPEILFERHYFHRLTDGEFAQSDSDICNKSSGGYGKFSAQYGKLQRAYALNRDAALRSASWGRFQIMGDNFEAAGFGSAAELVQAMMTGESAHLNAFVTFVSNHNAMVSALRAQDWAGFARRYNGPGFAKNQYDTKLKSAFESFSAAAAPTTPA